MPRTTRRSAALPPSILTVAGALLLLVPVAHLAGQDAEPAQADFTVELRVELREHFSGPYAEGEPGTWRAVYFESGDWTFTRRGFGSIDFDGSQKVDDLEASASPILVDGCGHQWVREWQDPARVEWKSEVAAESVLGGEVVAVWYRPIRASLVDPGGPRGKGECYDPDEEDDAERSDLVFDPSDFRADDTESGLPAVRDDGSVLLALIPWEAIASGEEVTRRVRYGDSRVGFRARLRLHPR